MWNYKEFLCEWGIKEDFRFLYEKKHSETHWESHFLVGLWNSLYRRNYPQKDSITLLNYAVDPQEVV